MDPFKYLDLTMTDVSNIHTCKRRTAKKRERERERTKTKTRRNKINKSSRAKLLVLPMRNGMSRERKDFIPSPPSLSPGFVFSGSLRLPYPACPPKSSAFLLPPSTNTYPTPHTPFSFLLPPHPTCTPYTLPSFFTVGSGCSLRPSRK